MATIAKRYSEPFSDINITPMIDVMLVLLVMLILTIPPMMHKVTIDLPSGVPAKPRVQEAPSRLAIARDGTLSWDGQRIAEAELRPRLEAMVANYDAPVLHMQTDPEARYERFDQVLAVVKRANVQQLGFIGDGPLTR